MYSTPETPLPAVGTKKRTALDAALHGNSISSKRLSPGNQHVETPRSTSPRPDTDFPMFPDIGSTKIFGIGSTNDLSGPSTDPDEGYSNHFDLEDFADLDLSMYQDEGLAGAAHAKMLAVHDFMPNTPPLGSDDAPEIMSAKSAPVNLAELALIHVEAWSAAQQRVDSNPIRVDLRPLGTGIMLYSQCSKKYAGFIRSPVLLELLDRFTVELNATLAIAPQQAGRSQSSRIRVNPRTRQFSARIVVHGIPEEFHAIGELLSAAGLYFQHPTHEEVGVAAEYCNPHLLLRPGTSSSQMIGVSAGSYEYRARTYHALADTEKYQIMQLFDTAQEPEEDISIHPSSRLISTLKSHQLTALYRMRERERGLLNSTIFPTIWERDTRTEATIKYRHRITNERSNAPLPLRGGILADEMGLGKTLSILALVCSSLDSLNHADESSGSRKSRQTLVIAPKSTIFGWRQQIGRHIRTGDIKAIVYHGIDRRRLVDNGLHDADLVLTTYETLRSDWQDKGPLYDREWYRLVLDEAHRIRNPSRSVFKAACAIQSQRRWCLTGTPIQNSLRDYAALVSFLNVYPFQTPSSFDSWIARPLQQRHANSLDNLGQLVRATCVRRTKAMVAESCQLPERLCAVEEVIFSLEEQQLYDFFAARCQQLARGLSKDSSAPSQGAPPKTRNVLTLIHFLRRICDHGKDLLPCSALQVWESRDDTRIDWSLMWKCIKTCRVCGTEADELSTSSSTPEIDRAWICVDCNNAGDGNSPGPSEQGLTVSFDSSDQLNGDQLQVVPSSKVEALLKNLSAARMRQNDGHPAQPIKSVVFSCWTKMLDLIEKSIVANGFGFERIDGKANLQRRAEALERFHNDPRCTVMLASLISVGEGVDLTSATRVHIMEPQWNPMIEAQAIDRAHRIGQEHTVHVTRYIMKDSVEKYVQDVQKEKLELIRRSINADRLLADESESLLERLRSVLQRGENHDESLILT